MAPGSNPGRRPLGATPAGFTLLELMVVMALLAIAVALVTLSLRDRDASQLDEEAVRLSALFEGARARSRATGQEVLWHPAGPNGTGFEFSGLSSNAGLPSAWLDDRTRAEVIGAPVVRLGPEPVIGAQRVVLHLDDRQLVLATDGLAPFAVLDSGAATAVQ